MDDEKRPVARTGFVQSNWTVNGDVYNVNNDLILNKNSTNEDLSRVLTDLVKELDKLQDMPAEIQQIISSSLQQAAESAKQPKPKKDTIVDMLNNAKSTIDTVNDTVEGVSNFAKTVTKVTEWVSAFLV